MEIQAQGRGEVATAQLYDGQTQLAMIRPAGLALLKPEVAQAIIVAFKEKGVDFAALANRSDNSQTQVTTGEVK